VLGSFLLFPPLSSQPFGAAQLDRSLIAGLALVILALFGWILRKGLAARQRPPLPTAPVGGELGVAETALAPGGAVLLRNELWSAVALRGTIARGAPVRVVGREGLVVMVEAVGDEGPFDKLRAGSAKDEITAVGTSDSSFVIRPSSK